MAGKTVRLNISGMTCDGCADTASRYLKKEKGVLEVAIQWQSGTGEVTFDHGSHQRGENPRQQDLSGALLGRSR